MIWCTFFFFLNLSWIVSPPPAYTHRLLPSSSPCHPVTLAAGGCAAGWPWVEAEAQSLRPPRPPPLRSSACPTNWTWTECRWTGPRFGPSAMQRWRVKDFPEEILTDSGNICTHLLHRLILRRSGAVVRVFLGHHGHLPALPHLSALFVLGGEFLHVAVRLATA